MGHLFCNLNRNYLTNSIILITALFKEHSGHTPLAITCWFFQLYFAWWGQVFKRLNFLIIFVRWDKDVAVKPSKKQLKKTTIRWWQAFFSGRADNYRLTI